MLPGVPTGQLERRFVGLGSGVGEEHALGKGEVTQSFRQTQGGFVSHHVGQVPDFLSLIVQRAHQPRMGMAQAGHCDAALEIDELAAFLIPDPGALSSHRNDGTGSVVGHHDFIEQFAADGFFIHKSLSGKRLSN